MGRRPNNYDAQTKAAAVETYLSGSQSISEIARDMGIPDQTVRDWIHKYDPARQVDYNAATAENLGQLIFDTVVTVLQAIKARAVVTGDPEWIEKQDASAIAALDAASWDRIIRVVGSFRPREGQPELPEPERNGSVDAAF